MNAKTAFNFPQSNKSGARKNSIVFMVAIIRIWTVAFSLGLIPESIQTAIADSKRPIRTVSARELFSPNILATIC